MAAKYVPQVKAAVDDEDNAAYFVAIKNYLVETNDGHMSAEWLNSDECHMDEAAAQSSIAASFGVDFRRLDDGVLVVFLDAQ